MSARNVVGRIFPVTGRGVFITATGRGETHSGIR